MIHYNSLELIIYFNRKSQGWALPAARSKSLRASTGRADRAKRADRTDLALAKRVGSKRKGSLSTSFKTWKLLLMITQMQRLYYLLTFDVIGTHSLSLLSNSSQNS